MAVSWKPKDPALVWGAGFLLTQISQSKPIGQVSIISVIMAFAWEACGWSDLKTGGLYGAREFDKIAGSDFGRAQARPQGEGQDGPSPSHPLRQSRRAAWLSDEGLQRRMAWRCALRSVNLTRLAATNSASRQFASSRPMLWR